VVVGEVRVELHADEAVLAAGVDVQRGRGDSGVGVRLEDLDLAPALDVEDPAVGSHVQLHRVGGVVVEGDLLEAAVHRAAAVAGLGAGGPLDAAEHVLAEERLAVGRVLVPHGGRPDASALCLATPGDRVVGAHGRRAGVVGRLVRGDQDMHVPARVGREVVPFLRALPALRQVPGGGVNPVGHLGQALQGAGRVGGHVRTAVDQVVPPGEFVLDPHVEGVVDRHDALARAHVLLQGLALGVVLPDHAGVLQHDQHVESGEVGVVEDGGVIALHHLEAVVGGQLLDHLDAGGDRGVHVAHGLGEQQCAEDGSGGVGRAGSHR
jgi:hypothetical protein